MCGQVPVLSPRNYLVVSPLAAENLEGKLIWNQPEFAAVLVDGKGYLE